MSDSARKITANEIEALRNYAYSSYSGRVGCMCGCMGTYKYRASHDAKASRGYDLSPDEISDRAVNSKVNKLIRVANFSNDVMIQEFSDTTGIVYHEESRTNAFYYAK